LTPLSPRAILHHATIGTAIEQPNLVEEDAQVTMTTPSPLERAIARYGGDLYRLALLLTSDEVHAIAALRSAMPRLATIPSGDLDEPTLVAALVAALPPERRLWRRGVAGWAKRAAGHAGVALGVALARLPRPQRLALGLAFLHGFEPEQAALVLGGDEQLARTLTRDALRALAPHVRPALDLEALDTDSAPADCRHTRAALALGNVARADTAARGHLALCAACRDAEQTWQRLTTTVEQTLRAALRDIACPERLEEDLRVALVREPARLDIRAFSGRNMRLALVAIAVLAAIALVVLPRRREPAPLVAGNTAGVPAAPRDLARQALDRLYTPPEGSGVWHGRWEIRWSFVAGSYAELNADVWVDTATDRHRVQLVHSDGGGPFEFELADEAGSVWYAAAPSYAPSIYPTLARRDTMRARLRVAPADRQRMLRARLESGAWDIAGAYLRQALAARELRSWGRQRVGDTTIEVIGFEGESPLLPPADAPDAIAQPTTILLSIDTERGTLYEVRELIGPEGGERLTRTTWRFVQGTWLAEPAVIAATFDVRRAWNGTGDFDHQIAGIVDPAMPLAAAAQVMPLAQTVQSDPTFWLLAAPPPGATRAVLLNDLDGASHTTVYLGTSRRLEIRAPADGSSARLRLRGSERVVLDGQQIVVIQPVNAQGYRAVLSYPGPYNTRIQTSIGAIGYTRAELLDMLRGFGPASAESYRAQAGLFADPHPRDQAAFDVLLDALTTPQPAGGARYFLEHTFTRHRPGPDPLRDPYHLPPYGGRPEQMQIENWVRMTERGQLESASAEHDSGGTVYARQYLGPEVTWYYDAPHRQANRLRTSDLPLVNKINLDQSLVLELLGRGGNHLAVLPDGTRVVSNSQALLESRYAGALQSQQQDPEAGGPYLGDLAADTMVTTLVYLAGDGRPKRVEHWAIRNDAAIPLPKSGNAASTAAAYPPGIPRNSILLEAWEFAGEEQVALGRVPPQAFDTTPPDALAMWDATAPPPLSPAEPRTTTITETHMPLFVLVDAGQIGPPVVEIGESPKSASNIGGNDIFEGALRSGTAVRLTYWLATGGPLQRMQYIYQGDARTFGAYLRTAATGNWRWLSSEPARLTIGERAVDGWRITLLNGAIWTLFELDGRLLAAQTDADIQLAALAKLQLLPQP
jgi:hypothetical protein